MPYTEKPISKKYWSIPDISKELKLPTSNIRFWIKHFNFKKRYYPNGWIKLTEEQRNMIHYIKKKTNQGYKLDKIVLGCDSKEDELIEIVNKYLEGNYLFGNESKDKMISELKELFL